jgi:hypothetical protein
VTHIDPDVLALMALSEVTPDRAAREHLVACSECSGELNEFTRAAQLGRSAQGVELLTPPDAVWARIHDDLGLPAALRQTPRSTAATEGQDAARDPEPLAAEAPDARRPHPVASLPTSASPAAPPPRSRRTRSARFWVPLVAAAAVVGLVGGVGVGVWVQNSVTSEAGATVIARAQLDPFPDWPEARGAAVVEEHPDGSREVIVDVDAAAASAGDSTLREVWLIAADASGLVSIGFLDGESGRFVIPAGINLGAYPLVDISAEPENGDPSHSGDSILRGELRAS